MANQTAHTAHRSQLILQHSNLETGIVRYSHAGRIIHPFLATVAIPDAEYPELAAFSSRFLPLGLFATRAEAEQAVADFTATGAEYDCYCIMQPGSPLFDRLLARLPQTPR